jgi:hypothetical protein
VTVNSGATLGGSGIINGAVEVTGGATFLPGNLSRASLAVSNNLKLDANSATFMAISPAVHTNDSLIVAGTLGLNGALSVTNLGGTPALGDRFQLITAGATDHQFSTTSFPPLATGLFWSFNNGVLFPRANRQPHADEHRCQRDQRQSATLMAERSHRLAVAGADELTWPRSGHELVYHHRLGLDQRICLSHQPHQRRSVLPDDRAVEIT